MADEITTDPIATAAELAASTFYLWGHVGTAAGQSRRVAMTSVLFKDASGNTGVGVTSPGARLHVGRVGDGVSIIFGSSTYAMGRLGEEEATNRIFFANGYSGSEISFRVNGMAAGNEVLRLLTGGGVQPGADNTQPLGASSKRWSVGYVGSGIISTSDERQKRWRGMEDSERRAADQRIARRILDELGWYQFNDAVAVKGPDGARWHFGARAQRVWEIVAAEKLAPPLVEVGGQLLPDMTWTGPVAPAWLTFDCWQADDERVAGYIFGFRVDEIALMLAWSLHDRLAALEDAQ